MARAAHQRRLQPQRQAARGLEARLVDQPGAARAARTCASPWLGVGGRQLLSSSSDLHTALQARYEAARRRAQRLLRETIIISNMVCRAAVRARLQAMKRKAVGFWTDARGRKKLERALLDAASVHHFKATRYKQQRFQGVIHTRS